MKRIYEPGYILEEDEFLLKIREYPSSHYPNVGFLSKFTQKGEIPKSFENWGTSYHQQIKLPTYVVKEIFKHGWRVYNYRSGKSQDWAKLIHPDGYTIEIYLSNFFDIIKENDIKDGYIIGKFKWDNHKLIKE